jgi:hypothetical protein
MPRQWYYYSNYCYITSQVFKAYMVLRVDVTKARLWSIFKGLSYPLDTIYHILVIQCHQNECHYIDSIHASAAFCSVIVSIYVVLDVPIGCKVLFLAIQYFVTTCHMCMYYFICYWNVEC